MDDIQPHEEEVELPLVEEEISETTEEVISEDSVETFDEQLESAETDEDFAKLGDALREDIPDEGEDEVDTDTDEDLVVDKPAGTWQDMIIKDGDIELTVSDENKARQLMQMGLNYGGKTTELAKHRSFVQYAEDNNISLDDIQMLKDIKSGSKDAYSALAKEAGISVYDVEEEHNYEREPIQVQQEVDPIVDMVASEILSNEEHTAQFQKWLPHMPEAVRQQVITDPNALKAVQADIQAGVFDKAMNQAYSDMRVNGMEFNAAYLKAKDVLVNTQPQEQVTAPITRGERQRASSIRGKASSKSKSFGTISDMSNNDFLENFQNIIDGLERPQ